MTVDEFLERADPEALDLAIDHLLTLIEAAWRLHEDARGDAA